MIANTIRYGDKLFTEPFGIHKPAKLQMLNEYDHLSTMCVSFAIG